MNRSILLLVSGLLATLQFAGQANADIIDVSIFWAAGTRVAIGHTDFENQPAQLEKQNSQSGNSDPRIFGNFLSVTTGTLGGDGYRGIAGATSLMRWNIDPGGVVGASTGVGGGFMIWSGTATATASPRLGGFPPIFVRAVASGSAAFTARGVLTDPAFIETREVGTFFDPVISTGTFGTSWTLSTPLNSGNAAAAVAVDGRDVNSAYYHKSFKFGPVYYGGAPNNPITTVGPRFGAGGPFTSENAVADGDGFIARTDLAIPFVAPIWEGDLGDTNPMYFQFDSEPAIGYGFSVEEDNRFKSFVIPDLLAQSNNTFILQYAGVSYALFPDQEFDFTTIDPTGVDSFSLLGFDQWDNIGSPFVSGLTFTDPTLASFTTFRLDASAVVPEPSTFVLAAFGATVLFAYGWRRKRKVA